MERKMRRFRQQLPDEEVRAILDRCTNGILSVVDTDGEPYGVPVSYAVEPDGRAIYLHSAVSGRKIDAIKGGDGRCSFCVVELDRIVPEEFTTYFRSVIVSGRIAVVDERAEVLHGLQLLCDKYSPGVDSAAEIESCLRRVAVLRIDVDSATGKEAIELVRQRGA